MKTDKECRRILIDSITQATTNGWTSGTNILADKENEPSMIRTMFNTGFARAMWGDHQIQLRDVKTSRGHNISQEAWRFHQHIVLDFIQMNREDLVYDYLEKFLEQ